MSVDARSQKRHWNGVHEELVDGELVLNFKSCLSNIVIIFNYLKLKLNLITKVWQTRSLAQSFFCILEKQVKLN